MIPLETTAVSRKTPLDGKLEVRDATARRLRDAGPLTVTLGDAEAPAAVVSMGCTCRKAGGAHQHQFLQSELLRTLSPELAVDISLDPTATPARVYLRPS